MCTYSPITTLIFTVTYTQGAEYFGDTSERYVGEYVSDLRDGQGSAYNQDGSLKYSGTWKQGHPQGIGTAYYKLYDPKRKIFTSQSIHGSFTNGVYVGPPEGRPTNDVSSDDSSSGTYSGVDNNTLFSYAKMISASFYQTMSTFVAYVLQTISYYAI